MVDQNAWYSRHIGVRYPSPFFDVGQTFMPSNMKELLMWCGYYAQTSPLVAAAVGKLAEYPVTDLIYEGVDPAAVAREERMAKKLALRAFQVEVGLDYFAYGNAFVSIYFPFARYLQCQECRFEVQACAQNRSKYRWRNHSFILLCPRCKKNSKARVRDEQLRQADGIKLLRWSPENVDVKYVPESGSRRYYYNIPRSTLNDIALGDFDVLETMPLGFLDAAREGKAVLFSAGGVFHLRRPTQAQKDQGWGMPLIMPVLKTAYYIQILQKAQETIAQEYIVPFRVLFPGPAGGGSDSPFGAYNLQNWQAVIRSEIQQWRRDPNHIGILPVNVNFQQWGGSGKALILHHELRFLSEQMLAGMGVPVEFVFGGVQWQGTNTSIRALANMFESYNAHRETLVLDYILGNIASYMGWEPPKARFARFEMPDNLQRAMFISQLAQLGKVSDQRLLEEAGVDYATEQIRLRKELPEAQATQRATQISAAEIQGQAAIVQQRYQAIAQREIAEIQAGTQALQAAQAARAQAQQAGAQPMSALAGPSIQPEAATTDAPPSALGIGEAYSSPTGALRQKLPLQLQGDAASASSGVASAGERIVMAKKEARRIRALPPDQQAQALAELRSESPQLFYQVLALLQSRQGSQENPMDGLRNPMPGGSGPGTSPGRMIG